MAAKTSSPASAFTKVLRSFETGGFTYRDVVAELKRLLKTGASPTEMSEILRRREFIEPLPVDAHREVLGLLDAAKERAAAEAIDQRVEGAGVDSVPASKPGAVPNEVPASRPAPVRIPTIVPSVAPAQTTIRIAPLPRISDPIRTPASKLITTPVQIPAAREMQTQTAPRSVQATHGGTNVVARAVSLARTSTSTSTSTSTPPSTPRSTSTSAPNLVQRRAARPPAPIPMATTQRIAEVVTRSLRAPPTLKPEPTLKAAPILKPEPTLKAAPILKATPIPTPESAPRATSISPAVEPVAASQPAKVGLLDVDDWSDLVISKEDLTADPFAKDNARKVHGVLPRGSMAGVIGLSAAVLMLAAIAWLYARHAPLSTEVPAVPATAVPTPGTLIRDCPTCAAMTVLPAARFKQGFSATDTGSVSYEKPQHWVTIGHSFAMSANLVTVDDFRQFIEATGRAMQGCETYDGAWKRRSENNWQDPGFAQSGIHPVTCVSWNDATAYAQWLSSKTGHQYRLPSASEWEYAARAGNEAVYPWASNGANACAYANVADATSARRYPGWLAFACDDGYVNTSPVGSFKANPLGLNDMLGNVFQWTQDCWHADYRGAPADGSARTDGDCSERELRGGSWFTSPSYVRANYRNHFASDRRTSSVGIRLVRDVGP